MRDKELLSLIKRADNNNDLYIAKLRQQLLSQWQTRKTMEKYYKNLLKDLVSHENEIATNLILELNKYNPIDNVTFLGWLPLPLEQETITNGDRIRSMNDEELADFIVNGFDMMCNECINDNYCSDGGNPSCKDGAIAYLKAPYNGGSNE